MPKIMVAGEMAAGENERGDGKWRKLHQKRSSEIAMIENVGSNFYIVFLYIQKKNNQFKSIFKNNTAV